MDKISKSFSRARFLPLLDAAEEDCLLVVVGTKTDLLSESNRAVDMQEALVFSKEINKRKLNEIPYFETSSKTGHNVNRVFEYILANRLPEDGSGLKQRRTSTVDLDKAQTGNQKTGCAC